MNQIERVTRNFTNSYKYITNLILNKNNHIKYNKRPNVIHSPFFMVQENKDITNIMGNIQFIKNDNNYSKILDDKSFHFV